MWSVSLSRPDCVSQVFDSNQRTMMPRYAVRRQNDISHVYCIVETTSSMSVVKVSLGDPGSEKLVATNIYEVHSSRIVLIEPDPDHS